MMGLSEYERVLAFAERADLLVDCSDLEPGSQLTLVNTATAPFDGSSRAAAEAASGLTSAAHGLAHPGSVATTVDPMDDEERFSPVVATSGIAIPPIARARVGRGRSRWRARPRPHVADPAQRRAAGRPPMVAASPRGA
jgi:hypothetical protein